MAERRNEILETTCKVVIERGFAGTRIADVAKRLDVSSSLIHYHFDSKEQLLAEAFDYYANKDVAEMEGEIESPVTSLGKLERVIQNYVPEGSDDVEWMLWIDGWGEALRNPMMKKISQQLDEQSIELLARVIRNGVESGEFSCPDPDRVGDAPHGTRRWSCCAVRRARRHDESRSAVATMCTSPPAPRSVSPSPISAVPNAHQRCNRPPQRPTPRCDIWSAATATRSTAATWPRGRRRGPTTPRGIPGGTKIVGRKAIVAAFERLSAESEWVVQSAPLMVFEVDEAHGTGTGRVTVQERFKKRKSAKPGTMLATYHDRYVRRTGTWVFAERRLEVIERT